MATKDVLAVFDGVESEDDILIALDTLSYNDLVVLEQTLQTLANLTTEKRRVVGSTLGLNDPTVEDEG